MFFVMIHYSRDTIKGRISGKRPSGGPCQRTLNWMIDKLNGQTYCRLKQKAQWRENGEWCTERD